MGKEGRVLAMQPDDRSLSPRTTQHRKENGLHRLSSDLHVHAPTHASHSNNKNPETFFSSLNLSNSFVHTWYLHSVELASVYLCAALCCHYFNAKWPFICPPDCLSLVGTLSHWRTAPSPCSYPSPTCFSLFMYVYV